MSDLFITNQLVSYREDLCTALSDAGFRILCYENGDIQVTRFHGKVFLRSAVRLLEKNKPGVVIVPEFSGISLQVSLLKKRFGFKLVSLCDDSMDMIQGNDFVWTHRVARRLLPPHLDGIILHGRDVCNWYRDRFGIKDLLMPIMLDEQRYRDELRRVLPLSERIRPGGRPVVAFVGRFVGLKNIPSLIRSFEPFRDRAQLVLIGDGPQREQLKRMAPYAVFTGMLSGDDLLAWYNLIDILVLPSTQEAYGAVTGEALMAGAKVIVSRRAGSFDLVREGQNGYLVDPMNVGELTARLNDLLSGMVEDRPLALRNNLHPYRFAECVDGLINGIRSL